MTIRVKKLDKRHTGNNKFKYYIESNSLYSSEYYEIRAWCWETWGPSKELHFWLKDNVRSLTPKEKITCQNEHWCWQVGDTHHRVYFRTDKELVLFKLRWE